MNFETVALVALAVLLLSHCIVYKVGWNNGKKHAIKYHYRKCPYCGNPINVETADVNKEVDKIIDKDKEE